MRRRAAIIAVVLAGCGGDDTATAPTPTSAAAPSIAATPASADDLVVARVDGRPVYGSCVAAQAAGGRVDRAAALAECIDLELLAGAAAARGLASDPAVLDARRQAMVSRLVDLEFTAKVTSAADLPASMIDAVVERQAQMLQQPLRRRGVYVRATLPKDTPAGAPEEARARSLIEAIHAELAGRRDLFPDDVFESGQRIAEARGMKVDFERAPYGTAIDRDADRAWRAALFAVPAIGMISAPTRTSYGWEVILWVDTTPATNPTREALLTTLFPDLRRAYFPYWTNRFAKAMRVERAPGWQQALQALEDE